MDRDRLLLYAITDRALIGSRSTEDAVEAALDAAEIYWEKTSTHLDDEDVFEVIYDMEV